MATWTVDGVELRDGELVKVHREVDLLALNTWWPSNLKHAHGLVRWMALACEAAWVRARADAAVDQLWKGAPF